VLISCINCMQHCRKYRRWMSVCVCVCECVSRHETLRRNNRLYVGVAGMDQCPLLFRGHCMDRQRPSKTLRSLPLSTAVVGRYWATTVMESVEQSSGPPTDTANRALNAIISSTDARLTIVPLFCYYFVHSLHAQQIQSELIY